MTDTSSENTAQLSAEEVSAAYTLARMRDLVPELGKAERQARLRLAAAIQAMDRAENIPGHHNLTEQASVELAMRDYARTLADFLRGDSPERSLTDSSRLPHTR
ncbi:hypothetical protein [Amycolatopsis sp. CA-230715]|uniref:hypothetical protein n=1 Tax=Amycolatopsis sp. CA-230715 TaxID=2745196 RepID=UPI001C020AB5|nr:hypothetical protein [Amycolatopsis sp. CA-230715]